MRDLLLWDGVVVRTSNLKIISSLRLPDYKELEQTRHPRQRESHLKM